MNILFIGRNKVEWLHPQPQLNHKIAFDEYDDKSKLLVDFNTIKHIPQIGQKVVIRGSIYTITDNLLFTESQYDSSLTDRYTAIAEYEHSVLSINFINYIRAFTHCYDNTKDRLDLSSFDSIEGYSSTDFEFIPPTTFHEWEEDVEIMNSYTKLTDQRRVELAMRRCKYTGNCKQIFDYIQ